jgi:uncharacterized protein (DUF1697 family)
MRLVAFLRAINVGGHVVKMDDLRGHLKALGFTGVETFIASGNVIFSSRSAATPALERKIEAALHDALGYEVKTFLRTDAEVAAIARYRPFKESQLRGAHALYVGFFADHSATRPRKPSWRSGPRSTISTCTAVSCSGSAGRN